MTTQTDFREVGEDFLEHFGVLGMRWGHRNSGYNYQEEGSSAPKEDGTPSPIQVHSFTSERSNKGKIAVGVMLGIVGVVLISAMVPSVRKAGMNWVKGRASKSVIVDGIIKTHKIDPVFVQKNAAKAASTVFSSATVMRTAISSIPHSQTSSGTNSSGSGFRPSGPGFNPTGFKPASWS